MSLRPRVNKKEQEVANVQANLAALKETWVAGQVAMEPEPTNASPEGNVGATEVAGQCPSELSFSQLNGTEKAAASLGVNPSELRPIGFLNEGHFEQLKKSNALDATLARRIEVRHHPSPFLSRVNTHSIVSLWHRLTSRLRPSPSKVAKTQTDVGGGNRIVVATKRCVCVCWVVQRLGRDCRQNHKLYDLTLKSTDRIHTHSHTLHV